ncbi:MAG: phosphatidylserine decarboxylase [Clostridiales bacterium]|nr:phosphatidylserine decarboxylase [Clostridiales bacterium]
MNFKDLDGNCYSNETSQDRLLKNLYTKIWGRAILKILVSPAISKLGGSVLNSRLSVPMIKSFIKKNNIDMTQFEERKFKSYNDFFTRKIKQGKRPFSNDERVLISPSDSKVSCYKLDDNASFSIKGTTYSCESLLKSKSTAEKFSGGYAFILRLSVDDYHRYSYCCSGIKSNNKHIKGKFHTVNPIAFDYYPVFKENTREYCLIKSKVFGLVMQMEVGATMVGKISNLHNDKGIVFKGEEKGKFEFGGSTVVLMVQQGAIQEPKIFLENTYHNCETIIKQGQTLAIN